MLSVARSQKANNFQTVMGLFLLASGSAKREVEVLAHAGLTTSYSTLLENLKILSEEAKARYRRLIHECMCSIVWDNLNIPFTIESERFNSRNHFDNGTTATLLPLWDPFNKSTRTPHGTLPLEMKPQRTSTDPIFDWKPEHVLPEPAQARQLMKSCKWLIESIALDHIKGLDRLRDTHGPFPAVDPIGLHKTEQFPLPAMHIDESSLEGTINVYDAILKNLGMTDELLKKHGLVFTDGDLLTDSLSSKVLSF
jgi:hypothetical protein